MKKTPHVIWACPNVKSFYRSQGEIHSRANSVLPKLVDQGFRVDVLIPHDPTLLPKTKLAPSRVVTHTVSLGQKYSIEILKLTRGAVSPGIYMVKTPLADPPLEGALFSHAVIALAEQINRPVDIIHAFDWEMSLLPLYVELKREKSRLFQNTRTFLSLTSLRNQGNYAPGFLNQLGLPLELFHPEGIEFFGKMSFLKAGLLFSDGVGIIEDIYASRSNHHRNGSGMEGVIESVMYKLRLWASDRSLKAHVDAYNELLSMRKAKSPLPRLKEKLHESADEARRFIESWGPVPPESYGRNNLSFLMQSPRKAYVFWEWQSSSTVDFGVLLEDVKSKTKKILARGLSSLGEYWIDVEPDHEYRVELLGWDSHGFQRVLFQSSTLRIPRIEPSPNTEAIFVNVKTRQRFNVQPQKNEWRKKGTQQKEGSSPLDWIHSDSPSSWLSGRKS